jgi:hypothetical protein
MAQWYGPDQVLGIQRTITLYGQLLDDLRMAEWGRLFTENAVWAMPGVVLRGRAAIVEGVRRMEPDTPGLVKHLAFTPVTEFVSDVHARAWTDLMFMTRDRFADPWKVALAGRYCDELVRTEDGFWRFSLRVADYDPDNRPSVPFEPSPSAGIED